MPPLQHAKLSASSAHRWLECPPSVMATAHLPDETTVYAEEGSAAHEVAEYKIRWYLGEKDLTMPSVGKFDFEEIDRHTDTYTYYAADKIEAIRKSCPDAEILVEQRLDFSDYVEGGFGTGDLVIVADDIIQVIDFKYGKGVAVSAERNPQMMLYALGALNLYNYLYDVKIVKMAIVQPRLSSISEWEIPVDELLEWAENILKPTAALAAKGEGEFKAGEHCRFCKLRSTCRKRAEFMLEAAKYEFREPAELNDDEIAEILTIASDLSKWADDVFAYAQAKAINEGKLWNGFKLVEGRSNRKYTDENKVADICRKNGYSISQIFKNPRNPNKHPKEQIAALAKIIKRQGWRHPIVVSNRSGFVVKGHGRLLAAKELNAQQVPVDYQDYESEASEYADLMADNKIQEFSELDEKLSADILQDIKDSGDIELEMSAFTEEALNELLAKSQEGEAKEDKFDVDAELNKPCFSKSGDIWHLGKHRVICGDSTAQKTYDSLLGDAKVNLVCTDPPYFVALQSTSGTIKNDDLNDKDGYEFLMKAFTCLRDSMARDASIYVFYATAKGRIFHDAFEDAGFKVGAGLVWKKDRLVLTRTDWKYIHEPILWGWRKDGKHKWYGDQKQKTVFEFDRIKSSKEDGYGHPSSKPVPLIGYLIEQCTASNGIVLDGFLGSASTLIACEQLNRICYGIELEPKFVDVAVMRYKKYLEDNGISNSEIYVLRDGKRLTLEDVKMENVENE